MSTTDALRIDISKSEDCVVVTLRGSASMELCEQLNEALLEACQMSPKLLAVDMCELEFICSLGLGGLVVAYLRVQKAGGELVLLSPSPAIASMLTKTKLGTLLPVYDSLEQARG